MAMEASDIEKMIKAALPDARIFLEDTRNDGDHYAALVIYEAFRGKRMVQQHQMVYAALGDKMGGELHAMALQTCTPEDAPDYAKE